MNANKGDWHVHAQLSERMRYAFRALILGFQEHSRSSAHEKSQIKKQVHT
jgi:hypothetical protein